MTHSLTNPIFIFPDLPTTGTTLGMLRYAAGIFKDLGDAAQQWTKTGRRTTPDPQKNEFYRERLNRYRAYIQAINEV